MGTAVLATEIFGVLALLIILYGACFESKHKSEKKTAYLKLLVSVLFALALDAITFLPMKISDEMRGIRFCVELADYMVPFLIYSFFLNYMYIHVSSKVEVSRKPFSAGLILCMTGFVSGMACGLSGHIFMYNDDNIFVRGEGYNYYLFSYILILVYTMIIVLFNIKKIGIHDSMAVIIFMIIPVAAIFINLVYPDMTFSISSLSLAIMIMNTMLQAEHEQDLIENEMNSSKLAHFDELTGLFNRLAYMETVDRMKNEGSIGVIFADVNGLKYANDNFGHKAGDKLLCDFSEVLLGCFRKDDIFRISGDEFVILLPDMPLAMFNNKKILLFNKINEKEVPIASFGCAYGSENDLTELIENAEKKMYEDKKIFHEKYPEYSRK